MNHIFDNIKTNGMSQLTLFLKRKYCRNYNIVQLIKKKMLILYVYDDVNIKQLFMNTCLFSTNYKLM